MGSDDEDERLAGFLESEIFSELTHQVCSDGMSTLDFCIWSNLDEYIEQFGRFFAEYK